MSVKMEKKGSTIYVWKGSKYTSAAVSISYIVIKKLEDKPHQYQSIQRFFSEYTLCETYPWFRTTLTKTNQVENTYTYQKLL